MHDIWWLKGMAYDLDMSGILTHQSISNIREDYYEAFEYRACCA